MHGFSSYDSCSTNSCTHTDTIRVCCMHTYICVFHFHNGILFRNEIAAKCNSIGVCSRRRQIITEYEKINESISVFDALNTHKHTGALTYAQWCCYYCRILNFHGKTWKLVAYLFFFLSAVVDAATTAAATIAVKFITEQTTRRLGPLTRTLLPEASLLLRSWNWNLSTGKLCERTKRICSLHLFCFLPSISTF